MNWMCSHDMDLKLGYYVHYEKFMVQYITVTKVDKILEINNGYLKL